MQRLDAAAAKRMQRPLLERAHPLARDLKALVDPIDDDRWQGGLRHVFAEEYPRVTVRSDAASRRLCESGRTRARGADGHADRFAVPGGVSERAPIHVI